jgi:hypothetical protein
VNTVNTSLSKIEQTDRQKAGQGRTRWGVGERKYEIRSSSLRKNKIELIRTDGGIGMRGRYLARK